jgi:hypothetical protein
MANQIRGKLAIKPLSQAPVIPLSTQARGLAWEIALTEADGVPSACVVKPEWIRIVACASSQLALGKRNHATDRGACPTRGVEAQSPQPTAPARPRARERCRRRPRGRYGWALLILKCTRGREARREKSLRRLSNSRSTCDVPSDERVCRRTCRANSPRAKRGARARCGAHSARSSRPWTTRTSSR